MNYGKALKIIRNVKNLSQLDLAEKSKMTKGYISKIEAGICIPRINKIQILSESLHIPLYIFIFLASDEIDLQNTPKKISDQLKLLVNDSLFGI